MGKGRLEAFSDGVLAIIITIMVLEMEAPQGAELGALRPLVPMFLSYALSFLYLGIYWSNHHHLLYVTHRIVVRSCGPTYTSCSGCGWSRIANRTESLAYGAGGRHGRGAMKDPTSTELEAGEAFSCMGPARFERATSCSGSKHPERHR